jgi:hypothetical protein
MRGRRNDGMWRKCGHAKTAENTAAGRCRTCFPKRALRDDYMSRWYGITPSVYNDLLAAQGGTCAICGQPPSAGKRLGVDHDHATGGGQRNGLRDSACSVAVRGLLCFTCNAALGLVKDNYERLSAMQAYLSKHHPREAPIG